MSLHTSYCLLNLPFHFFLLLFYFCYWIHLSIYLRVISDMFENIIIPRVGYSETTEYECLLWDTKRLVQHWVLCTSCECITEFNLFWASLFSVHSFPELRVFGACGRYLSVQPGYYWWQCPNSLGLERVMLSFFLKFKFKVRFSEIYVVRCTLTIAHAQDQTFNSLFK